MELNRLLAEANARRDEEGNWDNCEVREGVVTPVRQLEDRW
jgi:hypothetical protein